MNMPMTPHHSQRNRGQVLIITAILLSMTILGAVAYLNTATFTQYQQSQGTHNYVGDTKSDLQEVEYSLSQSIQFANLDPASSTFTGRQAILDDEIFYLNTRGTGAFQRYGGHLHISNIQYEEGVLFNQSNYDTLTIENNTEETGSPPPYADLPDGSNAPISDWRLFANANEARSFALALDGNRTGSQQTFELGLRGTDVSIFVSDADETDGSFTITVENSSVTHTHSVSASPQQPALIGISHGTIDEEPEPLLPNMTEIEGANITNGANVTAKLFVVAKNPDLSQDSITDPSHFSYQEGSVYAITADVNLKTERTTIKTQLRVLPRTGYRVIP